MWRPHNSLLSDVSLSSKERSYRAAVERMGEEMARLARDKASDLQY